MAAEPPLLTPIEAAIAGLLHDIGKLAQRAHVDKGALRAEYGSDLHGTESAILPPDHGRYTHRHALWSDFALKRARAQGLRWPAGLDGERLAAVAVRHHHPRDDEPSDWIITEADRLASGLERKAKDEEEEAKGLRLREVELRALLPQLNIDQGEPPAEPLYHPAEELSPEAMPPRHATPAHQPRRYGTLWAAWETGFLGFGQHALTPARFEQALLGLSERLLWAVPSSTVDQPDISLHDHSRAVAAIAAALAAWHRAHGETSVAAIKNRARLKFRLLSLDLSGIQKALLRLASAKGAGRILRARSFLMGWTVEAALSLLLDRLGLPRSCVLLSAGGKAEILAADLPDLDTRLAEVRTELDAWMIAHWQGDLALVLAAGPAFPAGEFLRKGRDAEGHAIFVAEGYRQQREALAAALDAAKLAPLAAWRGAAGLVGSGVIPAPFERAEGACASCGVRPAVVQSPLDGAWRCRVCDAAYRLGQSLPHADGVALLGPETEAERAVAALPGGLQLVAHAMRGPEAAVSVTFAREKAGSAVFRAPAHVPLLKDADDPRYRHAGIGQDDEEERTKPGDLMTFAHIAAEALEVVEGRILGRDLLGIIKADVDRLGKIFGDGLGHDRSPARIAQLSRLLDGYFSERLPCLLRSKFPFTYTVYAGGDDLLLVAPWRDALPLALQLREDFGAFAGENPNLTLSAGIAFVHPKHPLALAAEEADAALDEAKAQGRNQLGVFGRCLSWEALRQTLDLSEALNAEVRAGTLPSTFLHRMRWFAARRALAENGQARAADWNTKWQYHKARFLDRAHGAAGARLEALLLRALPPPVQATQADLEIAMTIALWRNR